MQSQRRLKLRIISDLHLGHGASLVRNAAELEPLFEDVSVLVFNGDTVEMRYVQDHPAAMKELAALEALCTKREIRSVFVNGNHDPAISNLSHLDLAAGEVLVTHGDMLFHDVSPWSKEAVHIGAAHSKELEALEGDQLEHFETRLNALKRAARSIELHKSNVPSGPLAALITILGECWPPTKPFRIFKVWAQTPSKAVRMAEIFRPRTRFVIIGHTHYPGIWQRGQKWIINTGGFLTLSRPLAVEIENGKLTVLKIVKSKECFRLGPVLRQFSLDAAGDQTLAGSNLRLI